MKIRCVLIDLSVLGELVFFILFEIYVHFHVLMITEYKSLVHFVITQQGSLINKWIEKFFIFLYWIAIKVF